MPSAIKVNRPGPKLGDSGGGTPFATDVRESKPIAVSRILISALVLVLVTTPVLFFAKYCALHAYILWRGFGFHFHSD